MTHLKLKGVYNWVIFILLKLKSLLWPTVQKNSFGCTTMAGMRGWGLWSNRKKISIKCNHEKTFKIIKWIKAIVQTPNKDSASVDNTLAQTVTSAQLHRMWRDEDEYKKNEINSLRSLYVLLAPRLTHSRGNVSPFSFPFLISCIHVYICLGCWPIKLIAAAIVESYLPPQERWCELSRGILWRDHQKVVLCKARWDLPRPRPDKTPPLKKVSTK